MADAAARFAAELLRLKNERGLSYRESARITSYSSAYVEQLTKGKKPPNPAKAHSYAATTLAWAGDPAAVTVARDVIKELREEDARPRRIASAQLDLGLALLAAKKPDEAAAEARQAIMSGRIVPSNWWRASEVIDGVCKAGISEAEDLRQVAAEYRPAITA